MYEDLAKTSEEHKRDLEDMDRMCRHLVSIRLRNGHKISNYRDFTVYVAEKRAEAVVDFAKEMQSISEEQKREGVAGAGYYPPEGIEYYARCAAERILQEVKERLV